MQGNGLTPKRSDNSFNSLTPKEVEHLRNLNKEYEENNSHFRAGCCRLAAMGQEKEPFLINGSYCDFFVMMSNFRCMLYQKGIDDVKMLSKSETRNVTMNLYGK